MRKYISLCTVEKEEKTFNLAVSKCMSLSIWDTGVSFSVCKNTFTLGENIVHGGVAFRFGVVTCHMLG